MNILRLSVVCTAILAFAGFLSWQLHAAGDLRDRIPPAARNSMTPNNGDLSTTFLLHIQPYWIFSEDYHLYYLRAKRMAAFGPVDDVLEPSRSRRYDLRNAAQVAITLLPALFGENLHHYAVIYFLSLAASLLVIFWATNAVTRHAFLSLCATMIVVTLVVEIRFYRISTTLFSLPLLVLILARLMRPGSGGSALARHATDRILGAALLALSALDVWAYLFGLSILCCAAVGDIVRGRTGPMVPRLLASLPSVLYLGATVALYSGGDLSLRAGMRLAERGVSDMTTLFNNSLFLYMVAGIAVIYALDRRSPGPWMMTSVVSGYAACGLGLGLGFGIDIYQLKHFVVFLKPLAAWVAVVSLATLDWKSIMNRNATTAAVLRLFDGQNVRWTGPAGNLLFLGLAAAVACNDIVSSRFIGSVQAATVHFANPRRHEQLLAFLQENVRDQRGRSFLTLSPELNYFIAFHSEFDMLLPSGFPLHSTRSNEEIALRMAGISRLLGIRPAVWGSVLQPGQDHDAWIRSRALAAQRNLLYDLYHRYGLHDRGRTRLLEVLSREMAAPSREPTAPDYILVDEVASSLQAQVPGNYLLIYDDHHLRLYRRAPDPRRAAAPGRMEARGGKRSPGMREEGGTREV